MIADLMESELAQSDVEIIADHIGAAGVKRSETGWVFKCPSCAAWDFWTANSTLVEAVTVWLGGGYLPRGVLLGGVCMACGHAVDPAARSVPVVLTC